LIPSEDLGTWSKLVRVASAALSNDLRVAREVVDFLKERNVVAGPVAEG
jgi:hypothetical protein